ncbi:MAG: DMT family transporter [Gammaproteobacteria bacterium]|nr:DMT family transporter [Gammaproteobacteria bacterium]
MQTNNVTDHQTNNELAGLVLGFLAISAFSVTLPATRLAVTYLDPTLVGLGRSLFVAIPALCLLILMKASLPTRRQWLGLLVVMIGVVVGFPWLTSVAMQNVSGAQGGIVVSVLPLFTAIAGALMTGQRPSVGFWLMALLGSGLVLIYLLWNGQGHFQGSDLVLLGASVLCAIGYAEGGRLARELGGVEVISWALVLSIPLSIVPVIHAWSIDALQAPWQAWGGFFYVSIISQWFAFMFWYRGLALGGVVRVSQVQLLQPFLTLLVAAILLDETITLLMMLFAMAVVMTVALGRRMPVHQRPLRLTN